MWGHLAGRISKIGDVVAPPLSDDGQDDDDEDEDYEEGEDDEEDEDDDGEYEEEEEDDDDDGNDKPVVGFVGFLTRALDPKKLSSPRKSQPESHPTATTTTTTTTTIQQQQQQHYTKEEHEEEEEDEDVIDLDQQPPLQISLSSSSTTSSSQQQYHHQSSALAAFSHSDEDLVIVPNSHEVTASMVASADDKNQTTTLESSEAASGKDATTVNQHPSSASEPKQRHTNLLVSDPAKPSEDSQLQVTNNTAPKPKLSVASISQQQQQKQQNEPSSATRLMATSSSSLMTVTSSSAPVSTVGTQVQAPTMKQQPLSGNLDVSKLVGATTVPRSAATLNQDDHRIQQKQEKQQPSGNLETKPLNDDDAKKDRQKLPTAQQPSSPNPTLKIDGALESKSVSEPKVSLEQQPFLTNENLPLALSSEAKPKEELVRPDANSPTLLKSSADEIKPSEPPNTNEAASTPIISPAISKVDAEKEPASYAKPSSPNGVSVPTKSENTSINHDTKPRQATSVAVDANDGDTQSEDVMLSQARCKYLESQLQEVQDKLLQSEQLVWEKEQLAEQQRQELLIKFQEKELRLLQASNEDHQQELEQMRQDADLLCQSLQQQMEQERIMSLQQQQQLSRLLTEAQSRMENAEESKKSAMSKLQSELSQVQQRQKRSIQMAEDKLAQALARIDERDEEIRKLKSTVSSLQSKMTQHQEGAQEAEEEMDELHSENETLQQHVQVLQEECSKLRLHVTELESQAEKSSGLQMELKVMRDAYERERALTHSTTQSLSSNHAQAEAERDAAMAEMRNLQQQLGAALADVNVARSDTERIMMANANLQNALEAFQSEREAEIAMLEDQHHASLEAIAAAHAAALDTMREANESRMREVSIAADKAVRNVMEEVNQLERKVEIFRKENIQLRRSLDEAIHQLQMNQEDVVDRTLMKNILLDWFAMKGNQKRQVLEMMASMLHFTEEEKERVHIIAGTGAFGKVVGAVAAPLPPAAVDHLEGDTVREKWINFLLSETDDGNATR